MRASGRLPGGINPWDPSLALLLRYEKIFYPQPLLVNIHECGAQTNKQKHFNTCVCSTISAKMTPYPSRQVSGISQLVIFLKLIDIRDRGQDLVTRPSLHFPFFCIHNNTFWAKESLSFARRPALNCCLTYRPAWEKGEGKLGWRGACQRLFDLSPGKGSPTMAIGCCGTRRIIGWG